MQTLSDLIEILLNETTFESFAENMTQKAMILNQNNPVNQSCSLSARNSSCTVDSRADFLNETNESEKRDCMTEPETIYGPNDTMSMSNNNNMCTKLNHNDKFNDNHSIINPDDFVLEDVENENFDDHHENINELMVCSELNGDHEQENSKSSGSEQIRID